MKFINTKMSEFIQVKIQNSHNSTIVEQNWINMLVLCSEHSNRDQTL